MLPNIYLTKERVLIALLVCLCAVFAFWIRILPLLLAGSDDILRLVSVDDPFYNLRQTEIILANFPQYPWYDPMTYYPIGTSNYWGPLFPTIIACICLLTGSATRPEIMGTALLVTPLMAAVIVVLMYFVGRAFGDWKTGLLASGFMAAATGQFYMVSMYGYIDHHIAEVLFSTIFCFLYALSILSTKETDIRLDDIRTWRWTACLAALAGIGYLLGLLVMPTMVLFAMIVGFYTLIQFVVDSLRGRTSAYLLLINTLVFIIAIIGLVLFGLRDQSINLSTYSIGHIFTYICLIGGTAVLYGLASAFSNKSRWYYPLTIIGTGLCGIGILALVFPQIFSMFVNGLIGFFGQQAVTDTVLEARGWSVEHAWTTYSYALLLFFGGVLIMLYNNVRDEHPAQVFAIVWSVVMFVSTWQHVRYDYYLAVNIALMSAVCIGSVLDGALPTLRQWFQKFKTEGAAKTETGETVKKGGLKRKKEHKPPSPVSLWGPIMVIALIAAVIMAGLFCTTSVSTNQYLASTRISAPEYDWHIALDWLERNSPDPGVGYLDIYNKGTFVYPSQSYGVMTWWDYGHMITYTGKRIPNANPFQQGVSGPNGSAAYFMTTSEEEANTLLDNVGTRYVMTDTPMDTGKMPAMATWYNATLKETPYLDNMFIPVGSMGQTLQGQSFYTTKYYNTMISRLHNMDGSMVTPDKLYYLEYMDSNVTNTSLPVITNAILMEAANASVRAQDYNDKAESGRHATLVSPSILVPTQTVPALRHYRLIYESPTNTLVSDTQWLSAVKTFEYVPGARIHGTGIIAVPVVTNTGRNFTYYQQSAGGEFVVPYSTTGSMYDTRATGKYRIAGTNQEFEVPESAVTEGLAIN